MSRLICTCIAKVTHSVGAKLKMTCAEICALELESLDTAQTNYMAARGMASFTYVSIYTTLTLYPICYI